MTDLPGSETPTPDWEAFLRQHQGANVPELDLTSLKKGDRLLVLTAHTAYTLIMEEQRSAKLQTNRPDRPKGDVVIHGCTFGGSSTIKPDHLFCGANLEFAHGEKEKTEIYTTTPIRALQLLQADGNGATL